jgi:hypothetical protein
VDFDHAEVNYNTGSTPVVELPPVAKGVQQITVESLEYGLIYVFTVKLVDLNGNKSLGSIIVVSLNRVVTDLNLDPYITAPAANSAPDKRSITGTQYTGTVEWLDGYHAMTATSFVKGRIYRVNVTLTANDGYTFSGLAGDSFVHSGGTRETSAEVDGGKVLILRFGFDSVIPAWYVTDFGDNDPSRDGSTLSQSLASVSRALVLIKTAYAVTTPPGSVWPGKGTAEGPQSAAIIIWGTLDESITIDNTSDEYPPIILRGVGPVNTGVIRAAGGSRVLTIGTGTELSLESSLTLTGGNSLYGGGVYAGTGDSSRPAVFTMKEGMITGNTSTGFGGGVYINSNCSFVMRGGSITNNTASWGGGVSINSGTFTMSGGTISDNTFNNAGGGVSIQDAVFTMRGGSIIRNIGTGSDTTNAGAVYVTGTSGSIFTLDNGIISDNESGHSGGAVYINFAGEMIMNGGIISGNKSLGGGGVTLINAASFTMNSGIISDNEAAFGGGVCTYAAGSFTMKGGTISGNTATDSGGGVFVNNGAAFKKEPPTPGASSGIIYGYSADAPNSNKVQNSGFGIVDNKGHAVYAADGPKSRETTAGPTQHLDSATADGWGE